MQVEEDSAIIQKVIDGDMAAFEILVLRYQDFVYSLILKIVQTTEEAEEIAQDTFMKCFQVLGTFKSDSKFSTWLYRIAYNNALSHLRKKKVNFKSLNDAFEYELPRSEMDITSAGLQKQERNELLEEAIKKLKPEDQILILLFYKEEKSIAEIIEITGMSNSNIKIKLHRLRKTLYNHLSVELREEIDELL